MAQMSGFLKALWVILMCSQGWDLRVKRNGNVETGKQSQKEKQCLCSTEQRWDPDLNTGNSGPGGGCGFMLRSHNLVLLFLKITQRVPCSSSNLDSISTLHLYTSCNGKNLLAKLTGAPYCLGSSSSHCIRINCHSRLFIGSLRVWGSQRH